MIRHAICAALALLFASALHGAPQDSLMPVVNAGEKLLQFDWPAIRIGTGEYEEGPTGVTVFHFPQHALAAVDVRGGGPGTVNTDWLRLGYDENALDTVVFSGGSGYGLENVTAVATALKDDGLRSGDWTNVALSVGAIIYDFGGRRLNEIYPDKRLAQAAFRAARPGVFPLGAQGAGRFAMSGGLFGCNAYSGQGGAFRQAGKLKIAAFVVVNALGVINTREGKVAACYRDAQWPSELRTVDLLHDSPASREPGWNGRRNTTISLVVVNQKMTPAELQRLAVQVHSSMGRAIQPFSTQFDGDVLYAVSTGEIEATPQQPFATLDVDVLADEVMWDAILSSVPAQPAPAVAESAATTDARVLQRYAGDYVFSPDVTVRISTAGGKLLAQAVGARNAYAITREAPIELQRTAADAFAIPGRYPLSLQFPRGGELVINPGHWQQTGRRQKK
jgi:L-aminopeptidase/D-esterase-like protein